MLVGWWWLGKRCLVGEGGEGYGERPAASASRSVTVAVAVAVAVAPRAPSPRSRLYPFAAGQFPILGYVLEFTTPAFPHLASSGLVSRVPASLRSCGVQRAWPWPSPTDFDFALSIKAGARLGPSEAAGRTILRGLPPVGQAGSHRRGMRQ